MNFDSKGTLVFPSFKKELSLLVRAIEKVKVPNTVILPMNQHQGKPAIPVVKPGDRVLVGTKVGEADGWLSAPVHASVSGTVKAVGMFPHPFEGESLAVQVESDGKDILDPLIRQRNIEELTREEILELVLSSGLVGLAGGAPLSAKLTGGQRVHTLVLNGIECEPYVTADYLTMLERSQEIVQGAKILKKFFNAEKVYLAVAQDKLDALETINSKLFTLGEKFIEGATFPLRYPQGEEKRLVKDLLSIDVPHGKTAIDFGVAVFNVATVAALYDAVKFGKPLYERVVTVAGECLAESKNLWVRIGTPINDLIRRCHGLLRKPGKLVMGGVLRGTHQENMEVPVIKTTSSLIALPPEDIFKGSGEPCTRCGDCLDVCPVSINPCLISLSVETGRFELARDHGVEECVSCGNCSYVCPSKRPMLEWMREAQDRPVFA